MSGITWTVIMAGIIVSMQQGKIDTNFRRPDCGVSCLYIIAKLMHQEISLDQLNRRLGPQIPEGFSMYELCNTLKDVGISSANYQIDSSHWYPDRPVICHLKGRREGHFVVLQPVGTTQTMVQVFDPPHAAYVTDLKKITSDPHWTGQILEPIWMYERVLRILSYACIVTLLCIIIKRMTSLKKLSKS